MASGAIMFENVRKERKSEVWNHFLYCKADKTAKCNIYHTTIVPGGSSTRSLIYHLKAKHGIFCKRPSYEESDQQSKVSRLEPQILMEESIGRLVAIDGLTFNQICNSSFIAKGFRQDGYCLLKSPNTIRELFFKEYRKSLETLKAKILQLKSDGSRFSVSFDESTSVRNRRYLNVNLHDGFIAKIGCATLR